MKNRVCLPTHAAVIADITYAHVYEPGTSIPIPRAADALVRILCERDRFADGRHVCNSIIAGAFDDDPTWLTVLVHSR